MSENILDLRASRPHTAKRAKHILDHKYVRSRGGTSPSMASFKAAIRASSPSSEPSQNSWPFGAFGVLGGAEGGGLLDSASSATFNA